MKPNGPTPTERQDKPTFESAVDVTVHASPVSHYQVYHELSDSPVVYKSLEEEFVSRLALVEDLHKRFHFMISELQAVGLRAEDDK